jgi:DNA-directed RNA polymerase subunit RPC12/RpoP
MRIGIAAVGVVLIASGLLLILLFWPLLDFETKDTFNMDDVNENDRIKYVGEITKINEFAGIYELELDSGSLVAFTDLEDFELNDDVVVTIEYGNNLTNWDESTYTVEKVPTMTGMLGALIFIAGLVVGIAGIGLKKPSLEDFVEFDIQPPAQSQVSEDMKIEDITCPKCKKVFRVKGTEKSMKIKCPHCGVEGILK